MAPSGSLEKRKGVAVQGFVDLSMRDDGDVSALQRRFLRSEGNTATCKQ